jgi:hypothetical protein
MVHAACEEHGDAVCAGARTRGGGGMSVSLRLVVGPGGPLRERAAMCISKEGRVQLLGCKRGSWQKKNMPLGDSSSTITHQFHRHNHGGDRG